MKNFDRLKEDYQEYMNSLNFSKYTVEYDGYIVREFIEYLADLGVRNPSQLLKQHLMSWQQHLAKRTSKYSGMPLKPITINSKIKVANGFLRYLADNGYVQLTMTRILKSLKVPQELPKGILKHEQVKKLLDSIDTSNPFGYRDRTILELMYSSGLRAGEVVKLNVSSIDFKDRSILVYGKGSKERIVPVGDTALKYLETYVKGIRPFMMRMDDLDALFYNHAGRRVRYLNVLTMLHRRCQEINIPRISCHVLRRSCATELIKGGANLWHVKEILGHENLDTLKHYAKLSITDLKKTHARCHPREKS